MGPGVLCKPAKMEHVPHMWAPVPIPPPPPPPHTHERWKGPGAGAERESGARAARRAKTNSGKHDPQCGGVSMREVQSICRSSDPPRPSRALRVPPPGDASRPLPFRACPAFTSTVGIGAASCSGVRFPNSSASTSMLLTAKQEANRSPTRRLKQAAAPVGSGARGLNRPRRAG